MVIIFNNNAGALHASKYLENKSIDCEAIDMLTASLPISGEIFTRLSMDCRGALKQAPSRLALTDFPSPTSPALSS